MKSTFVASWFAVPFLHHATCNKKLTRVMLLLWQNLGDAVAETNKTHHVQKFSNACVVGTNKVAIAQLVLSEMECPDNDPQ